MVTLRLFALIVLAVVLGEWIWWDVVTDMRAAGWIPSVGFWAQRIGQGPWSQGWGR